MMHQEALELRTGGGTAKMKELLASVIVSALGGSVHWMRHNRKKFSWISFITVFVTSAFAGMQAHFFMRYFEVHESLMYGIVGMIGYGSGTLLDAAIPLMVRWAYKKLGIEHPAPKRRAEDLADAE